MLKGDPPRLTNTLDEPPPISIMEPSRPDPTLPTTELAVTLGEAEWSDVTLYHNDKPIPTGLKPDIKPLPSQFTTKVRLVKGTNRFTAMASRDRSYNSLSDPVEISYEGPAEPSRLHIVAMGVGGYDVSGD